MSDTLRAALIFLITTVFNLYLFILIVRLVLAWANAGTQHSLTQFVVNCSSFVVKPLKKYIPDFRNLETATLALIFILEIIKFVFVAFLTFGFPNIFGLIIIAFGDMIKLILQLLFYAILLQAVISWIQPGSSINQVLYQFTSPIMRPLQRLIPPVAGFDISPIPALIFLQLLMIIIVNPLMGFGLGVAFA
jgi:YggT family protein